MKIIRTGASGNGGFSMRAPESTMRTVYIISSGPCNAIMCPRTDCSVWIMKTGLIVITNTFDICRYIVEKPEE